MGTRTPNLSLFKRDPLTEGSENFSLKELINDNLDSIDAYCGENRTRIESVESSLANPHAFIYSGSYTGTGEELNRFINTNKKPYMVIITNSTGVSLHCHRPCVTTEPINSYYGTYQQTNALTWSNNGVTIAQTFKYNSSYHDMFNASGEYYTWIAFCTEV